VPSPESGGSSEACVFFGVGLMPSVVRDDDVALAAVIFPDASLSQAVSEHLFVDPGEELPDPVGSILRSGVDPVLRRPGSGHPDEQTSGLAVALCDAHIEDVSVSHADVRESVVQPTALPRVEKAPCCFPAQNLNDRIVTQHDRILPCDRYPIGDRDDLARMSWCGRAAAPRATSDQPGSTLALRRTLSMFCLMSMTPGPAGGGGWLPKSERGRQVFKWCVWVGAAAVAVVIVVIGAQFGWKQV